jgi:SAM-dependent methyltransferase
MSASVSAEWEATYQRGGQAIRWPWSDVVSLVMRHAPPSGPEFRVLELGCGSGANIPFFQSLGVQYFSVEGSETAVARVRAEHPDLGDRIVLGDFTRELSVPGTFDLIVDRAALPHNAADAITRALAMVNRRLTSGGTFIGVDWYSTRHADFARGEPGRDARTRTGFRDGVFAGLGTVHFADHADLRDLLHEFEIVLLEHKLVERAIGDDGSRIATWNIVARKRA